MFRKTVLTTAIIGAGLGSMTGAAFAGDDPGDGGHHGSHDKHSSSSAGCSNTVRAESKNGSGDSLGDTTGGPQRLDASNLCHILTGNEILSNNNFSTAGSSIINGDTLTKTLTRTDTDNSSTTTTVPGA